jgi:hypothetical protein
MLQVFPLDVSKVDLKLLLCGSPCRLLVLHACRLLVLILLYVHAGA